MFPLNLNLSPLESLGNDDLGLINGDPPSFKTRQSKMEKINGHGFLLFWLNTVFSTLATLQISPAPPQKKPLVSGNKLKLIRQNLS